ncbi:MAG: twin-arginine translocation signal domain-containing protein [Betaproteobacteria bacterium]|nr:MAG: twin-arginine translocation signal domain-containing protein [Betaproteobacteria bacterium]
MKRRDFLKTAGAGAVAGATVAGPAIAQAPATIQWRLASSFPKSLDTLFGGAEYFARRVAQLTANRFQIRAFAAGEIVPPLQVLDAVQAGTIECGQTANYYYVGKNPAFAFDTTMPFGLNTRQQNAWMYAGGGIDAMRELFREYGVIQFPAGNTGAQMGGWFRKEIKTVADLKGLKFRIPGLQGQMLAKLGVVPQQIAGGEIYTALERGTIDAAEWVGPYDDEKLGFVRVAKYYYYPGFWEGTAQLGVLVNQKKWDELPAEFKAAIESAATDAHVHVTAQYDAKNPQALRRLVAGGAQLRAFPRPVMEAAYKAAFDLYDELSDKSPHFKRIYSAWRKFRDEEYLWFRVAENTFDNFVYSHSRKG